MILKLVLDFFKQIHLIVSKCHSIIFIKFNKKVIIKLKFIEFFQISFTKVYNKIYKKVLSKSLNSDKNYLVSRDIIIFHLVKNITEYYVNNNISIQKFNADLNLESKKVVIDLIKKLQYYYTHSLIDKRELFSIEDLQDEIEFNKTINLTKQKMILAKNDYEPSIFQYHCGLKLIKEDIIINNLKNKDFIDGGAYIGDSAVIFEKYYNPNKIYAFEPDDKNYNLLSKTIIRNNLKKIIPIKKGLGEQEKIISFKSQGALSSISRQGENKIDIITIDDFVLKNNLKIGLIKLDVEGYELNVLKGAIKTIKKYNPILLIAIYHNGKQFFETKDFIKKINDSYKFLIRKLTPRCFLNETFLIAYYNE